MTVSAETLFMAIFGSLLSVVVGAITVNFKELRSFKDDVLANYARRSEINTVTNEFRSEIKEMREYFHNMMEKSTSELKESMRESEDRNRERHEQLLKAFTSSKG
ncbi:hypothetical protein [Roseibium aggregatum]|uniref:Uncharacterized protein n=1 Tax=Roseibium aggregatum TaxID=187304 RepID=A0A0M6Y6N9_9HYPH|nr:hypothetical protein [Roseibium aggregatum]CTQ45762.1 hypothetical protein LAL4801_04217 [Roseibium aggregatum]